MEILKRQFVPMTDGRAVSALPGCLLLTDSDALATWAQCADIPVSRIDAHALADEARLLEAIQRLALPGVSVLLYGIGFEDAVDGQVAAHAQRSAQGMLALMKALLKRGTPLDIVGIRGASAVAAAMFDGIAMTACRESARLRYAALILDEPPGDDLATSITRCRDAGCRRFRLHAGQLQQETVLPLLDAAHAGRSSGRLRREGCYVLIGGAGGVGRLLSRWLSDRFGANVCALGRSPIDDGMRTSLKRSGVRAYAQADATDADALVAALDSFKKRFGSIDGVFHLAGVLRDRMIVNKPASDIDDVLPPKIGIALNLMRLPAQSQPGFVCAFTSLSGLIGHLGQSDYAAANAFVDALAETASRSNPHGRAAWFAINWGLWESDGMRMNTADAALQAIPADAGFAALERVLRGDDRLTVAFAGERRVLADLIATPVSAAAVSAPVEMEEQISAWIRELVFRFARLRDIDADESLIAHGMDSAALISLTSAIEKRLSDASPGIRINKAIVFDHPSIAALSRHLCDAHRQAVSLAFSATQTQVQAPSGTASKMHSEARSEAQPQTLFSPSQPAEPESDYALRRMVMFWLREILQRFTGLSDIAEGADLLQAGIDSVASINIAAEIERRLSITAPVRVRKTLVFDYPSLGGIADGLFAHYRDPLSAAFATLATNAPASPAAFSSDLDSPPTSVATTPSPRIFQPRRDGDIAIVGIAGEFPGADDIDALWSVLQDGRDAISVVPPERWRWQADYSANAERKAGSYGRHGGFLRRAKQFDPAFFGITPVEASKIDPQERRLLEMAYHALEDGGHFAAPDSDTGVFAAAMFGHYQDLDHPSGPISASFSSITNRISFTFDFRGPSLCVDTMCSGSLTALHLAIGSLRAGECRRALVGAVNVMPHPGKLRLLSEGRFLSPTGRCHSFGIEADGYVPGEGAIALLLKPLADAVEAGDRIHGVIRGSALNAGGRVSSFTVPSARAQEDVIRKALTQAGVNPAQVDYIEAHGTGTRLGDPIEIAALDAAYGAHADGRRRLGSIKSNIGHLESAAGLAGLIKVLLQFRHRRFAPTLHCTLINPYLQLETTAFALSKDDAPWYPQGRQRIAGLSAFGAGGSNAHVILEEYPHAAIATPKHDRYIFALSARNTRALRARAEALADWIDTHPDADPYSVACTLALHREHLRERVCIVAADAPECARLLRDWLARGTLAVGTLPAAHAEAVDAYLQGRREPIVSFFPVRSAISLPHYPFDPTEYWDDAFAAARRGGVASDLSPAISAAAAEQDRLIILESCWHPMPPRSTASAHPAIARCLVVCNSRTAEGFRDRPEVRTIVPGERFEAGATACRVRIDRQEDLVAAIRHVAAGEPVWMVVCSQVFSNVPQQAAAQFGLAKAAIESGLVERIAYVYDDQASPTNRAASAMYRVLGMEEAQIRVATIEVETAAFDTPATLLDVAIAEFSSARVGDPATRVIGDRRWSAGLRRATLGSGGDSRFRQGGVYLITGGLGMIGQGVAEVLASRFAANIILVGRSPASAETDAKLASLRSFGGSIQYLQADVGAPTAADHLVRTILQTHGTLHGVIHSAGVLRDGLLRGKSLADFETVMHAKMASVLELDQATADIVLDFFVMFSSMSGLFGNIGQADYAFANAWLDAFATKRHHETECGRRSGLTLSIDWPLWYDDRNDGADRMSDYRSLSAYLRDSFGIEPLPLSEGSRILVRLIENATAQTTQLAPFVGDVDRIFACVRDGALRATAVNSSALSHQTQTLRAMQASVLGEESVPALADALATEVTLLTGLARDEIDRHATYGDLGLNSLMLQQLAGQIEARFELAIPPSALFTYNSIAQLSDYLVSLGAVAPTPSKAAHDPLATADESRIAKPHEPQALPTLDCAGDDRVAIIGIDGRLPGGHDLAEFWRGLIDHRSAVRKVERWDDLLSYAGTIPDIDHFDPKFFGISAREAMLMDPQHRLFLQCSYNAMLDSGYSPREVSAVGVFAGVQFSDYQSLLQASLQGSHPYAATGNAHAMLANRVSYLFDFEGPSQTIDTACSSALVAINRAIMALRAGECDYAVAGAVSLLIDPAMTRAAESMGVLSPQHRCATFDADADGYVRAEGVGCVFLKRLEDALRDGDAIHAVIEAAVENHGGRANSLTAPNPNAQRRLLLKAYSPRLARRVSYIETHGTGTKLGDPVEIDALSSAWRELVPDAAPASVAIGSVKSNIGHLEPAAGIASLLKVVLAFRHRELPANLHYRQLNPYIRLTMTPFEILSANARWDGRDRVAGISSFGFGGTNAHIVLSESVPPPHRSAPQREPTLIVLSARTPYSLMRMKSALEAHLRSLPYGAIDPRDLATTLACGREHFEYRLAWVVEDLRDFPDALRNTDGGDVRRVVRTVCDEPPPLLANDAHAGRDAFLSGVDPQSLDLAACREGRRIHLPGYAFDTKAYWFETVPSMAEENR